MKSALLREPGAELVIESVEPAALGPDEVLVRIVGVGVCHTDLTAMNGTIPLPLPAVLGHEGAGVVEQLGPEVTGLAIGDHVVLSFDSCRECASCTSGHPAYCELFAALNYFGTRLDGTTTLHQDNGEVHGSWFGQSSFGTHAVASARNAVKVDDDLPLELLGPLGCGLLTGAGTVLNVLRPEPGEGLAIWGLGTVGLAAVMAAKVAGCDPIIGVDPNPERCALALELGATHALDPAEHDDLVWSIMEIGGGGVRYSIDGVGHAAVVREALGVLTSPGTCATVGLKSLENDVEIDQGHLLLGRTLTGVIEGDADPHEFVPRLTLLWRQGKFPFDRLVRTYPFAEINAAIDAARRGEVVKPVLTL